jgi:hypothetical protein
MCIKNCFEKLMKKIGGKGIGEREIAMKYQQSES